MIEWLADLAGGFATIFDAPVIFAAFLGVAIGTFVGAVPGLTVIAAISLAIPITFTLEPITAILINTPGTPAAAATVLDGYPMARNGQSGKALKMALYASVFADAFSILVAVAEPIARFALRFGPPEVFSLLLFSLTIIAAVSGRSLLKGVIAAGFGCAFAIIGQDPMTGSMRFAFDNLYLQGGIQLIPMLIGLFAISELFVQAEKPAGAVGHTAVPPPASRFDEIVTGQELRDNFPTFLRASLIGSGIGALPGIGSTVASFLSYGATKRRSKHPELFGKGSLEGVAAAEAGNNAVVGAAMIPMLTLGIPGDPATAVLMGALMIHGKGIGAQLFDMHREFVYGLFAVMLLSIAMLYVVGLGGIWLFRRITQIPGTIVFPVVAALCMVGTFAVNNSLFDVGVMLVFGCIGYVMRRTGFPLAPLLIAFVLAPRAEMALRQSLIMSKGSIDILFTRPISLGFLVLTLAGVVALTRFARLGESDSPAPPP